MPEQRQFERVAVTIPVQIMHGDDQSLRGFMLNLSRGGMFVRVPAQLPARDDLHLRIAPPQIPGDDPIHVPVRIVHASAEGIGLSMLGNLGESAHAVLDDLILEAAGRGMSVRG